MTTPYHQRRRDPQPISQGWEIAAAAIGVALLGLGLAAVAGLGLGSALFGGGWVWPHGTDTVGPVIGGVLTGHPGRGFPPTQLERVASPGPTYGCIAGCELLLITVAVVVGVLVARYRRPNDARSGMARRSEAEQVLGLGKLRAAKEIIRPDLYGTSSRKRSRRPSSTGSRHPQPGLRQPSRHRNASTLITGESRRTTDRNEPS